MASKQKTRGLGPMVLLVKSVGLGQGMEILGPTREDTGQPGKKERGRGSRERPLHSHITHTLGERGGGGAKPCSFEECGSDRKVARS